MKGLRKIIYPFAPDQSGAAAVFYEMGGMIIICDAGGCAGNICGFDEPRWFHKKSAIFSAGLRDMDAILGRDDLMIEKIKAASGKLDASFVAIVGTPVPATIATDYTAIRRMGEKRIGLPVVTTDTNGALLYDSGIEKAYLALIDQFAEDCFDIIPGSVGVLGATPLDLDRIDAFSEIRDALKDKGASQVICYGEGLDAFRIAGRVERNIVVSPSGLKAARELKKRFGTPYTCEDPLIDAVWTDLVKRFCAEENELIRALDGKRILVIHQQIRADALRKKIKSLSTPTEISTATWFKPTKECREPGDVHIREEDDFFTLMEQGYDVVIADESFRKAAKGFAGMWLHLPHFAVSGDMGQETVVAPKFYT